MLSQLLSADINLIRRILPHRYPFLLVDKVIDINGSNSAVGIKSVTINEPYFQGHFPSQPVMPGVFIIEAMAQTAAVMVGVSLNLVDQSLSVYFITIDSCKFRRMVVPGDVLQMRISTLRGREGNKIWRFKGQAEVDNQLVAVAEFTAMVELPQS